MATIEHFAIYAADAPALKDFYVEAFGLQVVLESGGDPAGLLPGRRPRDGARDHRPARGEAGGRTSAGSATSPSGSTTSRRPTPPWSSAVSSSRPTPAVDNDADQDRLLQRPRGQPLPDRLAEGPARGRPGRERPDARLLRPTAGLAGDLAPPLDRVAVLGGELDDLLLRLRHLDPRDLAIGAAARPLPGHFLAVPLAVEVVNDQALHLDRPPVPCLKSRPADHKGLRCCRQATVGYRQGRPCVCRDTSATPADVRARNKIRPGSGRGPVFPVARNRKHPGIWFFAPTRGRFCRNVRQTRDPTSGGFRTKRSHRCFAAQQPRARP